MYRSTTECTPQYGYRRTAVQIQLYCGAIFSASRPWDEPLKL